LQEDAHPDTAPEELWILFGDYQLIEEIARGGCFVRSQD
jgi:hypothetical protein